MMVLIIAMIMLQILAIIHVDCDDESDRHDPAFETHSFYNTDLLVTELITLLLMLTTAAMLSTRDTRSLLLWHGCISIHKTADNT